MKAINLKTEYLSNPIGIDMDLPRLFWNCDGGTTQSAYQIVANDDNNKLLWDSGKVISSSMRCKWGSAPVPAATRVIWKVRLWDENDEAGEWANAAFETGIDSWQAKWISGNYKVDKKERYPVDCFRKFFSAGDIKKARLYITACGVYEAKINGRRVGDFILSPGITDYRKRVQYQTYDVTELLSSGKNEMTVQLADGWYRGSVGAWGLRNQYGTETKIIAQLEITRSNGQIERICSDEGWDWSNDGPILFADNKDGEIYDANRTPSYGEKAKVTAHKVIPCASNNVFVTEHERFSPKLVKTPSGKTVLDFGQNIAGYVSFSLNAAKGQKIKLRFGEMLDENGEFTQKNIQCSNKRITTPLQQVDYTCKDGANEYKTAFAIFGFQYVLVDTEIPIAPDNFTAIAVYSDMEQTLSFESSNELLNKLVQSTIWSTKNNSCDLPTDCPTRERHGWSGDAQIFCPTASYLFNYIPFAQKYLNDLYDWQTKNGCLPQIAPEGGTDFYMRTMNGSVGWADAGVFMPYTLWKMYGDEDILKKYLPGMRKYAGFMENRCGKIYPIAGYSGLHGKNRKYLVNCGPAYGEWAEPDDVHHMVWTDCVIPHPEVQTAYTVRVMECMAEIEMALGNEREAQHYTNLANECRESYRALVKTEKFTLDTDRQASLVRPLAFKLLDAEQEKYAEERLIKALDNYNWRVGTGFLSTPLIMDVLTDIDIEKAYKLLENEEMPGWLCMPKNGASTIWEAWEGTKTTNGGIASLDHYSKGAVCRWLFDTMCGIKPKGENEFIISPRPGGNFTFAQTKFKSIYGEVSSSWTKEGGKTTFTVSIPANCTALIRLPDGSEREQSAGTLTYSISEGEL